MRGQKPWEGTHVSESAFVFFKKADDSEYLMMKAAPSKNRYADYMKERYKRDEGCLEAVKIDRKVIDMVVTTKNFFDRMNDQKYKEYLACSYKKMGYQTPEGVIQYNNIKTFLSEYYDPSDLKGIDDDCKDFGESHGDKAFNALLCLVRYLGTIDIKPKPQT